MALEGSESPTGRGTNGALALGAAPTLIRSLMPRLKSIGNKVATLNTATVRNATVALDVRLTGAPWRRIRREVLIAAKWLCQCIDCRTSQRVRLAHEVDHVTPLWDGGSDHRSNLQAINRECHARKTADEATRRASIAGSAPAQTHAPTRQDDAGRTQRVEAMHSHVLAHLDAQR